MTDKSEEQLQAEIRELRGELGETVEALAYKADVPQRVKDRAEDVRGQAKARAVDVREQAKERAVQAREQAKARAVQAREQAKEVAERARHAAQHTAPNQWTTVVAVALAVLAAFLGIRALRGRCQE